LSIMIDRITPQGAIYMKSPKNRGTRRKDTPEQKATKTAAKTAKTAATKAAAAAHIADKSLSGKLEQQRHAGKAVLPRSRPPGVPRYARKSKAA
jgi:hypothetical protein